MDLASLTRVQLEELIEDMLNEVYEFDMNLACKFRTNIEDLIYTNQTLKNL